jgi:hypothetical protein
METARLPAPVGKARRRWKATRLASPPGFVGGPFRIAITWVYNRGMSTNHPAPLCPTCKAPLLVDRTAARLLLRCPVHGVVLAYYAASPRPLHPTPPKTALQTGDVRHPEEMTITTRRRNVTPDQADPPAAL